MKKLFSITELFNQTRNAVLRFPLTVLSSLVTCILILIQVNGEINDQEIVRINMVIALGLPLFTALHAWTENINIPKNIKNGILLGGTFLLLLVYWNLPDLENFNFSFAFRYIGFAFIFHLLVSVLPFYKNQKVNAFWQFNKSLFLRYLLGALYSGVLFGGLSLALLAIQQLLGISIHEKVYVNLWVIIALPFNTIFFVGGLPQNILDLEELEEYPKGLRLFVQYVLMPLVVVYLLILYVYGIKISFLTTLPDGWVTYLILAFAVAGMLTLLLIHPFQKDEKYAWVRWYTKMYYWALWPLVILLFIAIGTRLLDYGWTENRVVVVALALWLTLITTYFTWMKKSNIIFIPFSLIIFTLAIEVGPLSAESIAMRNQRNRLNQLLDANHWKTNQGFIDFNSIQKSKATDSLKSHIHESLTYLSVHFGSEGLVDFIQKFPTKFDELNDYERGSYIDSISNVWDIPTGNYIQASADSATLIRSYHYNRNINELNLNGAKKLYVVNSFSSAGDQVCWINQQAILHFINNGVKKSINLAPMLEKLPKNVKGDYYQTIDLNNGNGFIDFSLDGKKYQFVITSLVIEYEKNQLNCSNSYGTLGYLLEY
jgi:hypothetical protein